jgi:hypothetical protein
MEATLQLVGMKAFRKNLARYANAAKRFKKSFIVLRKNVPVFEVAPVDEKKFALEKLKAEIREAREQVKQGKVYSSEEVAEILGL